MALVGILLIALALVLADPVNFARLRHGLGNRALATRFIRIVPGALNASDGAANEREIVPTITKVLRGVDPSFASLEDALRGFGYAKPMLILCCESAKILAAFGLAVTAGCYARRWGVQIAWASGALVFLLSIAAVTHFVLGAVRSRRRQLNRELIASVDFLTVFLQGGQSLEQAFRALAEVAGPALPALGTIQRGLVADMDNGVSFERALDRWASSIGSETAQILATFFKETLLHGTELVPQLRRFSVDLLERRLVAARENIGRKSAQLTMVMVVFFLPAILLFMGGPAFAGLISGLRSMR
jgi:tight adherence protein C